MSLEETQTTESVETTATVDTPTEPVSDGGEAAAAKRIDDMLSSLATDDEDIPQEDTQEIPTTEPAKPDGEGEIKPPAVPQQDTVAPSLDANLLRTLVAYGVDPVNARTIAANPVEAQATLEGLQLRAQQGQPVQPVKEEPVAPEPIELDPDDVAEPIIKAIRELEARNLKLSQELAATKNTAYQVLQKQQSDVGLQREVMFDEYLNGFDSDLFGNGSAAARTLTQEQFQTRGHFFKMAELLKADSANNGKTLSDKEAWERVTAYLPRKSQSSPETAPVKPEKKLPERKGMSLTRGDTASPKALTGEQKAMQRIDEVIAS